MSTKTRWILSFMMVSMVFVPLTFGTPPLPPPYYEYNVTGTLERLSGGSKGNFTVTLLGRFRNLPDSGYVRFPPVTNARYSEMPIGPSVFLS